MRHKRIPLILAAIAAGILASTYKVEHIEEVCAHTGSSIRYERYFSRITTSKRSTSSWIEEALRAEGIPLPEHLWVKTMGDTWTVVSFSRYHAQAPDTYPVRQMNLIDLRKVFGAPQTLKLAQQIAFGTKEERTSTLTFLTANF